MTAISRLCVFCGSNTGSHPSYANASRALARELVRRGIGLVYGGGCVGLMGILADEVLAAGGHVTGVIPHALVAREVAHHGLPDLRIVSSMHERKAVMASLSDAFVALPGGFGTFEEFCEVVTWTQLGLHSKCCGLLNVTGYFDPLLALFDSAVREGFLSSNNRNIVVADGDPAALLDRLTAETSLVTPKWIGASLPDAVSELG